jgi:predicted Holliday junction resolvase-like endonuclease
MEVLLGVVVGLIAGALFASVVYSSLKVRLDAQWEERVRKVKEEASQAALKQSAATLKGQVGERFAPFVPGFKYQPADARFLGSPIDYIVFDGLAEGELRVVAFVEIKTGAVPLSPFQKQVRAAIQEGRVEWRTLQLPEGP